MIILADRNFAAAALLKQIAATGAQYLVRVKNGRHLPVHQRLPDHSYLSVLAGTPVRVITARTSLHTTAGQTRQDYTLITTVLDPQHGTSHELIRPYNERWAVESTFKELKSTLLTGKVLRSRTIALPSPLQQTTRAHSASPATHSDHHAHRLTSPGPA